MKKKIWLLFSVLCICNASAQQDIEAGKQLFNNRCASCHAVGKRLVGPDLQHISERRESDWLYKFITNSQSLIAANDKDAVAIFEEYNKIVMPTHLDLKTDDIQNILAYIEEQSQWVGSQNSGIIVPDRYKPYNKERTWWHQIVYLDIPGEHTPITKEDRKFWLALFISILSLIALLVFLVVGNEVMHKLINKIQEKSKQH